MNQSERSEGLARASGASPSLPRRVLVWLAMLARPPIDDSANDDADDSDC